MSTAHATKLGNWQMVYSWKGALSEGDVQVAYQIKKSFCFFVFFLFWWFFEQLLSKCFEKLRETFWKISSNLGKAPLVVPYDYSRLFFVCCSAKQCPSHRLCVRVLVPFSPVYLDHDRSLLHPGYRCWDDCFTFAPCRRAACSAGGKRVCIGTINGW